MIEDGLENEDDLNPHQTDVWESLIRQGGKFAKKENGHIGYIFAFDATKMGSRDSGDTRLTLIGSRTGLGPSMD